MEKVSVNRRKRGRPPKDQKGFNDTRAALIRAGLEVLTEKGFVSSSIDEILKKVSVPKGSYYHYFGSKEDFGRVLVDNYISFFAHKIEKALNNESLSPLERLRAFVADAAGGMERYDFKRGCLIGNMGQEIAVIPESFREQLQSGFELWQKLVAGCLKDAQDLGEISESADCLYLAGVFWIGWEGAVMRTRIEKNADPLFNFADFFISGIEKH